MELLYVLAGATVAAVLIALLINVLLQRMGPKKPSGVQEDERVQQLESQVAVLRDEKSSAERRLAAEEQKALRVPELEMLLSERAHATDAIVSDKAEAERQVAVATEALTGVQAGWRDTKDRLAVAERSIETLRADKGRLDEALAAKCEAVTHLESLAGEIRGRLVESEAARVRHATRIAELGQENTELRSENAGITARLAEKTVAVENLTVAAGTAAQALETTQHRASELDASLARVKETLEQERRQSQEKLVLLEQARERMTQEFKVLADDVMKSHGESFSKQNREQIDAVLGPLKEKLVEFQQGLQFSQAESAKERSTLAEQIRQLSGNSERMSMQAASLARALRGEAQTQGAWGEMILSSILERSGLREGEEYATQETHASEEGQRLRPDVIVTLPGSQRLVIDSKVSLVAFDAFVNAASDQVRTESLNRHVTSLRGHIKSLADKEYHAAVDTQLDYVVMFIPIEGALAAALQQEPDLTAFAIANNIAIATPTTLMIALRTVANVWHVERRNRNAESIAVRAGRIYDKLVGFIDDMQDLGNRLNQAHVCHEQAMRKLSSGRGNLVQQVERLKSLGARTAKSLPETLIEAGEDEPISATVEEQIFAAAPPP